MSVITVLSVVLGGCGTIYGIRRNAKSDDKKEATESTTLLIKLENIQQSLTEIKTEMRGEIKALRTETTKLSENQIRMDESIKSAWKAINKMQDRGLDDGK